MYSQWIYLPYAQTRFEENEVLYFRRDFVARGDETLRLRVGAEHRYELYLNGRFVGRGPVRGDETVRYYDRYDLTGRLAAGTNRLAVRLLHYTGAFPLFDGKNGPLGFFRKTPGGLMVEGVLEGGEAPEDLGTCALWRVRREDGIRSLAPQRAIWATNFEEHVAADIAWDFATRPLDESWLPAFALTGDLLGETPLGDYGQHLALRLLPSPLPPMREEPGEFCGIVKTGRPTGSAPLATRLPLAVAPHERVWWDFDAGEMTTAYPRLRVRGGAGSAVTLLYAEGYFRDAAAWVKGVRDDTTGELAGERDVFHPDGPPRCFSPFAYRTFRYVRLEVCAAEEAVEIEGFDFVRTGYPLEVESAFASGLPELEELYAISVRTLRRCMHDTYIDCPYFEQLQYALDTRLEALFTYTLSRDDRLARRALEDFHCSLTPDGLTGSRYPSAYPQRIPCFALQYIGMLHDHMQYFGDAALYGRYLPTVDAILSWFARHTLPSGLVCAPEAWGFIDWVEGWKLHSVPPLQPDEGMTVLTEMAAYACRQAAELAAFCGREGLAGEYALRAEKTIGALRRHCLDAKRGLFRDGERTNTFSEHGQLWAVLCGAATPEQGRTLLACSRREPMPRASYAHSFFLFRALEIAGLYTSMRALLHDFFDMTRLHLTTWLEDAVTQRSDCHGWGSVPIYELLSGLVGIRPAAPGFRKAVIRPTWDPEVPFARGRVPADDGPIEVEWRQEGDAFTLQVHTAVPARIDLPDGTFQERGPGTHAFSGRIDRGRTTCR